MKEKAAIVFLPWVAEYKNHPPLAPALLKSLLHESGIGSRTFDLNLKYQEQLDDSVQTAITSWIFTSGVKISASIFNQYQSFIKQQVNKIIEFDPTVVMISLFSHQSQRVAEDLCFHLKANNPDIFVIAGGSGVHIHLNEYKQRWCDIMLNNNLVDTVLQGEGEHIIHKLFVDKKRGMITLPQLDNDELVDLPVPNFDDYVFSEYGDIKDISLPVTASKGCVRNCTFCDVAAIWPKFRYRRGKNVADEMIGIYKKYGINKFRFTDSLINGGLKPFRDMNTYIVENLPNVLEYNGQFIARDSKSMPPSDFDLMKQGGCNKVWIGIESGSEDVRNHMKKKFSDVDLHYTAEQLLERNITQYWNIIVGYPTETEQDWQASVNLIERYRKYNQLIKIVPVGVFQLLQNTPISKSAALAELEIENHNIGGYTEYGWISKLNPTNTLASRVSRYKDLIEIITEYNMFVPGERLQAKLAVLEQQRNFYEEQDRNQISVSEQPVQEPTNFYQMQ